MERRSWPARGRATTVGALAAIALVLAACGGGDGDSSGDGDAATTVAAPEGTTAPTEGTEGTEATEAPGTTVSETTEGAPADFDPGETGMRVVNLLEEPVDVYVRSTGFVVAYPMQAGVAPGEVTEVFFPPEQGSLAVLEAGASGADCVADCPQIIAQLTAFEENGPVSTVVLYEDDGERRALDLWEQPSPDRTGNANAMVPADPEVGIVVVTAVAVDEADFGLRMSVDGAPGCVEPFNLEGILIGGNQTPAFELMADPTTVSIHGNQDRECAEEPVGGPFELPGAPGTRVHLLLSGTPGDLDAIVLPMSESGDDGDAGDTGDSGDAGGGGAAGDDRRALAVELMAAEAEVELGLDPDQAYCAAGYIVDALGADLLLDGDELVDLDSLPAETSDIAGAAVAEHLEECGIDPAQLGG